MQGVATSRERWHNIVILLANTIASWERKSTSLSVSVLAVKVQYNIYS